MPAGDSTFPKHQAPAPNATRAPRVAGYAKAAPPQLRNRRIGDPF